MNKRAYIEGYLSKEASGDNMFTEDADMTKLFDDFSKNPRIKMSKFIHPISTILGAGLGTYVGHRWNKHDPRNEDTKKMILGGTAGGMAGSFIGSVAKDKMRWPEVINLIKNVKNVQKKRKPLRAILASLLSDVADLKARPATKLTPDPGDLLNI